MRNLPQENADEERRIRTFEDLDVWKFCGELRKKLTELARRLPREEAFRLVDQMIRAARSITNNLAEGYGRFHYQENIQFCRQSRASLYESIDHLTICLDDNYINKDDFEEYRSECERNPTRERIYSVFEEAESEANES